MRCAASLLAGANIKVVCASGHSGIQITLASYTHTLPQMEDQAAASVFDCVPRSLRPYLAANGSSRSCACAPSHDAADRLSREE